MAIFYTKHSNFRLTSIGILCSRAKTTNNRFSVDLLFQMLTYFEPYIILICGTNKECAYIKIMILHACGKIKITNFFLLLFSY